MRLWGCKAPEQTSITGIKYSNPFTIFLDLRKLARSFRFALIGFWHVLRTEQNMRVHLVLSGLVACFGWYLEISREEWGLVLLCIGAVMAAECFNSSMERLADRISQEEHYLIRVAKDAAAGGVLMVSLSTAAVGALIFLPKLWVKLHVQ